MNQPSRALTGKQKKFVKGLVMGLSKQDSAKMAGYSPSNASTLASQLLRKQSVVEAMDRVGLNERGIAKSLKTAISTGLGVKSTNSDAIAGLRMALEVRGALNKNEPQSLTQNNVYIAELKSMDDTALASKVQELTDAVQELQH